MTLGILLTVSCALTAVTMLIFTAFLFVLVQSGGRGVQALFNRFLGGGNDDKKDEKKDLTSPARARPQISSGDALRQRAQQFEFNPQAAATGFTAQATGGFNAQSAPQQASFTAHDPLAMPPASSSYGQGQQQYGQSGFNQSSFGGSQQQFGQTSPSMPSLSSPRPFDAGQQPLGGQSPQYGQQSFSGQTQQYGQPQQSPGGQSQFPKPLPPIGGQTQQSLGGQQQYRQPPLPPIGGQSQQYGQQNQVNPGGLRPLGGQDPQQQGSLGQYNPPLQSRPNFDQNTAPGLRRRRDSRKGDDRDTIYDDGGGLGGIIDDLGGILD